MPFIKMPGVVGKVYVPEAAPDKAKKNTCKDCYFCQMCSDDRCRMCKNDASDCRCLNLDECPVTQSD